MGGRSGDHEFEVILGYIANMKLSWAKEELKGRNRKNERKKEKQTERKAKFNLKHKTVKIRRWG